MHVNYYTLLEMLMLIKYFYDLGKYDVLCGAVESVDEEDYYELILSGLESIAPIYKHSQIATGEDGETIINADENDYGDHWHDLYTFSSPDMLEYYRLCRLYEYKHAIEPEKNKYVKSAEQSYCECLRSVSGSFYASFDSDRYTTKLWIEICPEDYGLGPDLIYCIHEALEYYTDSLSKLRCELMQGAFTFLPQLPAYKGDENVQNNL